ncbi:MAG: hypothetical protein ACJA09_003368 [Alcanivorax sp.]|jgi:hypothetical protein
MFRQFYRGALLLIAIALIGCGQSGPEATLAEYSERLQRTLNVDPGTLDQLTPTLPPRSGELQLDIPSGDIGTLEFMSLSGCAVQTNIGRRNSSLGRVAAPSQRLLLDLEFLQLAPACITTMAERGEDALEAALTTAYDEKNTQLHKRIFNATLGGPEYRQLWRNQTAPAEYPGSTSSAVISALEAINALTSRWLTGDYRAENRQFEIYLSQVAAGDGGELWRALATQQAWLSSADKMLQVRATQGPLCQPGRKLSEADILKTVVHKFFIGEVQPHSAALARRYHNLLPPLLSLEQQIGPAVPELYREWADTRNQQLTSMLTAPRLHVDQIKGLLDPCNAN